MKFGVSISVITLFLCACATYDPASLNERIAAQEAECSLQTWASETALVICLDGKDRPLWQSYASAYMPYYLALHAERLGLAQQLDARQIDAATFNERYAQYRANILAKMGAKVSQDRAQSEASAQTLMLLGSAFLNGYNNAKAATPPPITTTCTENGAVVNCTSF